MINLAAICTPADYNTRPLDTIYSNFIDALPVVCIFDGFIGFLLLDIWLLMSNLNELTSFDVNAVIATV